MLKFREIFSKKAVSTLTEPYSPSAITDLTDEIDVVAEIEGTIVDVIKLANPLSVPEPGGLVAFTIAIDNKSPLQNSVTITRLTDNVYGDLNGQGNCAMPQVLLIDKVYICTFTQFVAGDGGETVRGRVTALGEDTDGNAISEIGEVTVTIDDVPADVELTKTTSVTSVPEPGGPVTFTFNVKNISVSTDPITILTLTSNIQGDLHDRGDCRLPQVLASNESYSCNFQAVVTGNAGDSETNIITAQATDDDGNVVTAQNQATVTIDDILPSMGVIKSVSPSNLLEPGRDARFTVIVNNSSRSSTDPITLTQLVDDIHGDLAGQGNCLMPQLLLVGQSYRCAFTASIMGNAGMTKIDTVTATGQDDEGNTIRETDDATVNIVGRRPEIILSQNADPVTVEEAGADVTFSVIITNVSIANTDPVTLITLTDTLYGNLHGQGDCTMPQTISPDDRYACGFTRFITGNVGDMAINVITAMGMDDEDDPVSAHDDTIVVIEDTDAIITLVKIVDTDGDDTFTDSETLPEPGGQVDSQIIIRNDSTVDDVTITEVNDSVSGDDISASCVPRLPVRLAPGEASTCRTSPEITGNAGQKVHNIATATGIDEDGESVAASDRVEISLTDVKPILNVIKKANPISVTEVGGDVQFIIEVQNASTTSDPVTLHSLIDDIYGDLNGRDSCSMPQTLEAGKKYRCAFMAPLSGNAEGSEISVVTATGTDDENNEINGQGDATVAFVNSAPVINVIKTTNPINVPEPKGNVSFTVVVQNDSNASDPVTIKSLLDDIHGDLDGQGDCSVPQTIAPGHSYGCAFNAVVEGNAGDSQTSVITASGTDDEEMPFTTSDDTVVTISNAAPTIIVIKSASVAFVGPDGADVTFSVVISNASASTDPVTIHTLADSLYGDLDGQGSCTMPQTLEPPGTANSSYRCEFTVNIAGDPGDTETSILIAEGEDDEGTPAADGDDETVTVDFLKSFLSVTNVVDAATVSSGDGLYSNSETVPEPGGPVSQRIEVQNISSADITVTDIKNLTLSEHQEPDIVVGCVPKPPTVLGAGDKIVCKIDSEFSGNAGSIQHYVASATGINGAGYGLTDFADATVIVANTPPALQIAQSADPATVLESGGNVNFTFVITNNSVISDPVNIFSLQDSFYGNLDGQGDCLLPQTIPAGDSYRCSFRAFVERNTDDPLTHIAITAGTDDEENQAIAYIDQTVFIEGVLPAIKVTKSVDPTQVDEPGDRVNFVVAVQNDSTSLDPIRLNQLIDDVHGNLSNQGTCVTPQPIQSGASYICSFTAEVSGDAADMEASTAEATALDDEGQVARERDSSTITIGDILPTFTVIKSANPNAVTEPGGNVAFTVIMKNDSVTTDPVTVTKLIDTIHGNLHEKGSCSFPQVLQSDQSYACTFTDFVGGNADDPETSIRTDTVTNIMTDNITDTVTATVRDNEGNRVDATGSAAVIIRNAAPVLRVEKSADVDIVSEAGGDVTFTITVSNESASTDPLTLSALNDSIYGDLNGQGSCSVPRPIQPGASYGCTFTAKLTGNAGESETAIVTATGEDDEGHTISAEGSATVVIGNVGSSLQVTKVVDANGDGNFSAGENILAPGGSVDYRIVIKNNSAVDRVTLQSVDAPPLGDLSNFCVPSLPTA